MGAPQPTRLVAYGYDLGGLTSRQWYVREVDEQGCLTVPWMQDNDFQWSAHNHWQKVTGLNPDEFRIERIGFDVIHHGEWDEEDVILAAVAEYVTDDRTFHEVRDQPYNPAWDQALAEALRLFGLTPLQPKPAWLERIAYT
ncbi:hypothetical protein [Actinomadura rudentiformis]|uniref:Uncharacterized protein n=1 Tax=Actinomadura rudentiformis TaxID=359158 RepID=A0A6H9YN64_9ACTN|nr:hypothetical protein [Actinomadura rudentiformis]KAB2344855.1 hypothetical protein F8566_30145 [Actinomadura rudentiformis]